MSARPLPAHWASDKGLDSSARKAFREAAQRVFSDPVHVRRARQKKQAQDAIQKAADAGAFAVVAGAAGNGLVKHSTSQTKLELEAVQAELRSGEGFIEFTQHEARLARMARAVRSACKLHHIARGDWPAAMFTLTHEVGEAPNAKDVSHFVDCLKKWAKRGFGVKTLRYVWVAELQEDRARRGDTGAVHYHVAVWLPPALKAKANEKPWLRGNGAHVLPKPDKKGWWKKGSTERAWVRKSVKSYLSKYISKGTNHAWFPKGLRIHAAGGFHGEERMHRQYMQLPKWLKEQVRPEDKCVRALGGGWVSQLTGERFASPYLVIATGRVIRIVRMDECNAARVGRFCELQALRAAESALKFSPNSSVSMSA